jgi:multimeric flavodoxin WrbA
MKTVAFNGSARKNGNTTLMIKAAFVELEQAGIDTELVHLAGKPLRGCQACYRCMKKKDRRCAVTEDALNDHLAKMVDADAIVLASPTYFADVTSELKALMDRAGMVSRVNDDMLQRKVGAAISVARRGGAIHTFDSINHFFFISQMVVPGSNYWNLGFGKDKGDVAKDEEAMAIMTRLGQNMAWLLGKLHA